MPERRVQRRREMRGSRRVANGDTGHENPSNAHVLSAPCPQHDGGSAIACRPRASSRRSWRSCRKRPCNGPGISSRCKKQRPRWGEDSRSRRSDVRSSNGSWRRQR